MGALATLVQTATRATAQASRALDRRPQEAETNLASQAGPPIQAVPDSRPTPAAQIRPRSPTARQVLATQARRPTPVKERRRSRQSRTDSRATRRRTAALQSRATADTEAARTPRRQARLVEAQVLGSPVALVSLAGLVKDLGSPERRRTVVGPHSSLRGLQGRVMVDPRLPTGRTAIKLSEHYGGIIVFVSAMFSIKDDQY